MNKDSAIDIVKTKIEMINTSISDIAIPSLLTALNSLYLAKIVLERAVIERDRLKEELRELEVEYDDL